MNKWVKKSIPLAVAASMAFTVIPGGVDAKSDNGKGNNGKGNGHNKKVEQTWKVPAKKKFYLKDVESHWANQDIYKMYSLGLMSGYDDFTYQPNKPVTQLEVISSLVRVLELDGKDRNPNLSNKNLKEVPNWAKTSVAIAIEEGLLEGNKKFQPNKPATRLFITNLLVQLVGNNIDDNWEDATPLFKDVDNLSKEEKAILAFAALTKLVSGYSDNTFQPNKPVTRAEMAVFINRLLNYKEDLGDYYTESGNGTIVSIDARDSEITIKQRVKTNGEWKYVNKDYTVDDDAKIYVDGKAATLSKLTANMGIEFTIDEDDNIIYIKAKSVVKEVGDYTYNGVITKIDNDVVWVKVDRVTVPFLINSNVKITTKSGAKADLNDLKVDQKIAFNLNSSGAVSEILIDAAQATDNEIKDLINKLDDLEKLTMDIKGDNDFKASLYYEKKTDNSYVASVKLEGETEYYQVGRTALKYLVDLFEDNQISFDKDDVEIDELKQDLIDKYDVEDAVITGSAIVDGITYDLSEGTIIVDKEIKNLLNELGDLNKIDLEIDGDNNALVDIYFDRKSDYNYEAQVKIVSEDNRFEFSGKTALTFLANFIDDENIDFSDDDQSEVDEFVNDLIDQYNITDADIDGVIVIDNKTFNL